MKCSTCNCTLGSNATCRECYGYNAANKEHMKDVKILKDSEFGVMPFMFELNEEQCENPHSVETFGSIDSTLEERGKRYGKFKTHADITQYLKQEMRTREGWIRLSFSQREALEMIAHKIGRILNGDPDYADSWHDIAGYAKLVEDELNEKIK